MLIRVLAKSKQDDIYTLFDRYDRLIAFGWGYATKGKEGESLRRYDIYTKDAIYLCERSETGAWNVNRQNNLVGKIPAIVFIQEKEWAGAESLIERLENCYCRNADINDTFGSPAVVATGQVTNARTLPLQEEESRFYELANGGDIKYLLPADVSQSRREEANAIESQIMEKTFTPNITLEALRGPQQRQRRYPPDGDASRYHQSRYAQRDSRRLSLSCG